MVLTAFCGTICTMKRFVVIAFLLSLAACSRPAPPATTTPPADTRVVKSSADVVKLVEPRLSVAAGTSDNLLVPISIEKGYHINANPATFDYLIATELTIEKADGVNFGKPIYPAAEKRKFQFAEQPLAVYEGQVQIKLPVQVAANAPKGKQTPPLKLRVQACDEEKCFPPDTLQVSGAVDVR